MSMHHSIVEMTMVNNEDASFITMTFHFLPLQIAFDVMMNFLAEGVKIIYRYTYGLLKYMKDFIKTLDN